MKHQKIFVSLVYDHATAATLSAHLSDLPQRLCLPYGERREIRESTYFTFKHLIIVLCLTAVEVFTFLP